MTLPLKQSRPGMARVEYLANREETEAMLARGYSVRMVWEYLQEQGRMQCGYSAFCDYVRGRGKRKHGRKEVKGRNMQASKIDDCNAR
jgi:hypothetical protein